MSTYLVGDEHIDMLLTAAVMYTRGSLSWTHDNERHTLTSDTRDAVGTMLLGTNQASVNHRYRENDPMPTYTFTVTPVPPSAVEALKGIQCLEYQSDELPDYASTEAAAFLQALTANVIRNLPGYDVAPWEWTVEKVSR